MHRISLLQRMALFVFTMLFSLEPVLAQEDTISGNDEAQAGKVMDTVAPPSRYVASAGPLVSLNPTSLQPFHPEISATSCRDGCQV